jgi:PST family polysaccharide transporter
LIRIKVLRPEHFADVFAVSLLLGATAYAALVSTAGLIGAYFREPAVAEVVPYAALTFLITPFGTVPAALMTRDMQFRRTAAADWISSLGEAALAVGLAWAGYGYWSIIYGRVAGSVLNAGCKILLGNWSPSLRFTWAALHELLSFGTGIFAKRLLDQTAKNVDNLVVGRLRDLWRGHLQGAPDDLFPPPWQQHLERLPGIRRSGLSPANE